MSTATHTPGPWRVIDQTSPYTRPTDPAMFYIVSDAPEAVVVDYQDGEENASQTTLVAEVSPPKMHPWCNPNGSYRYKTKAEQDFENYASRRNANLIASAPELLALAHKLSSLAPSNEGLGGHAPLSAFLAIAQEARSIIAKATA